MLNKARNRMPESYSEMVKEMIEPRKIVSWSILGKKYGFRKRLGIPYIHCLLDLASSSEVVVSEALTPARKNFLEEMVRLYEEEKGTEVNIWYKELQVNSQ